MRSLSFKLGALGLTLDAGSYRLGLCAVSTGFRRRARHGELGTWG